ncbi:hypothetical protein [Rhizobium leguminosarum]|uniref:hypothetical protein n=1 Tax=Rhizobium leguminosarum TaxID=384 RepID=UPI003F9CE373
MVRKSQRHEATQGQAIKDGVVECTVDGLLTFAPLKMCVKEFSDWANWVIEEPLSH